MPRAEKLELSDLELNILGVLEDGSIKLVSYHQPRDQLGEVLEGYESDEVSAVLRDLETRGVLKLDPLKKLRGVLSKKGAYIVNTKEAGDLLKEYEKQQTTTQIE